MNEHSCTYHTDLVGEGTCACNTRRAILHSDINCCYAQIECQAHPNLRDKPVAVGGNEENRHGIVLAKNMLAKAFGVKTGDTLRDARRKCPQLIVVPPDYRMYMQVSKLARRIYYDYSDMVEPFGPDEAWIRVDTSVRALGMTPLEMAREISERMKAELGISVSIGVSWNKIFAKFGSDYKKPDAITAITPGNYQRIVWQAPVRDLLYVGAATEAKLKSSGICTIGDLAHASDYFLQHRLGKMGFVLREFARGNDVSEVKPYNAQENDVERAIKSYGNGITFHRDIADAQTAKAIIWMLAESVTQRMRQGRARGKTVAIGIRRADLTWYSRQAPLPLPSNITGEVARVAWELLQANEPLDASQPLRSLNVRVTNLEPEGDSQQLVLFDPLPRRTQYQNLDRAIDELRRRFGNNCIIWGPKAADGRTKATDIMGENIVHPESFFHR